MRSWETSARIHSAFERYEVFEALDVLATSPMRRRTGREFPRYPCVGVSIADAVSRLYSLPGILCDLEGAVGICLVPEDVACLQALDEVLSVVVSRHYDVSDRVFLNNPEWPQVVKLAAVALTTMQTNLSNGYPFPPLAAESLDVAVYRVFAAAVEEFRARVPQGRLLGKQDPPLMPTVEQVLEFAEQQPVSVRQAVNGWLDLILSKVWPSSEGWLLEHAITGHSVTPRAYVAALDASPSWEVEAFLRRTLGARGGAKWIVATEEDPASVPITPRVLEIQDIMSTEDVHQACQQAIAGLSANNPDTLPAPSGEILLRTTRGQLQRRDVTQALRDLAATAYEWEGRGGRLVIRYAQELREAVEDCLGH